MRHFYDRYEFAREIKAHWSFKLTALAWGVIGLLVFIRDNLLSRELQEKFATLSLLPHWAWYWWAIGFLVIGSLMLFEGSHRAYRQLKQQQHEMPPLAAPATAPPQPAPLPPIQIVNAPNFSNTQNQGQSATATTQRVAEPPPRPEPKYNFYIQDPFPKHLLQERSGYSIVQMPQYHHGFYRPQLAWLAEITNRAHDEFSVAHADDVVAELQLDGTINIGPLVWMGSDGGQVSFSIGHPETVILAVSENEFAPRWMIPRFRPHKTEGGYRDIDTEFAVPVGKPNDATLLLSRKGRIIFKKPLLWLWNDKNQLGIGLKPQQ